MILFNQIIPVEFSPSVDEQCFDIILASIFDIRLLYIWFHVIVPCAFKISIDLLSPPSFWIIYNTSWCRLVSLLSFSTLSSNYLVPLLFELVLIFSFWRVIDTGESGHGIGFLCCDGNNDKVGLVQILYFLKLTIDG